MSLADKLELATLIEWRCSCSASNGNDVVASISKSAFNEILYSHAEIKLIQLRSNLFSSVLNRVRHAYSIKLNIIRFHYCSTTFVSCNVCMETHQLRIHWWKMYDKEMEKIILFKMYAPVHMSWFTRAHSQDDISV